MVKLSLSSSDEGKPHSPSPHSPALWDSSWDHSPSLLQSVVHKAIPCVELQVKKLRRIKGK